MDTTKQYHLYYTEKELKQEVVLKVRALIKEEHFFKLTETEKLEALKKLSADLCKIYGVEDIKSIEIEQDYYGVGGYCYNLKRILLNKCSLVTFLHEFKHHLQHTTQQFSDVEKMEEEARGYSHSLYFCATPILFKSAVERGLLIFQKVITEET
jgi:hypothetical protein